jgi:hypothetical protein
MGIRNNGEAEERASSDPRLEQATGSICSLNEAWLNMLDRCFIDSPLSEVILPLMRICFFGGATHAVFLLDKGHGREIAADIAAFLRESRQSLLPPPEGDS